MAGKGIHGVGGGMKDGEDVGENLGKEDTSLYLDVDVSGAEYDEDSPQAIGYGPSVGGSGMKASGRRKRQSEVELLGGRVLPDTLRSRGGRKS